MATHRTTELDGSIGDFMSAVRDAFQKQFPPIRRGDEIVSSYWIRDIFEDSVVVRDDDSSQLFRVNMTRKDDGITFAPRNDWEKVKLTYTREMISDSVITEFRGNFPKEMPVRPGVDLAKLTEGDDNPFFLTLEISSEGRVSQNGLLHDADFGGTLVGQIMTEGAEGIMGHIKEENRVTDYPVSDIHWIGAVKEGAKTWAKGYIPRTATAQREHFRILAATNGKAATSVYGRAVREFVDKGKGIWKAKGFELEQLDLAPYKRAALPPESGFVITSETTSQQSTNIYQKETEMSKLDVIRDLTSEDAKLLPDSVREAILAGAPETSLVADLRQALGVDEKADLKALVADMKKQQAAQAERAVNDRINELANDEKTGVKLETARAVVVQMVQLRRPTTPEEAERVYGEVVASDAIKNLLKETVQTTMGPRQSTPVQPQNGNGQTGKYFVIPAKEDK